jgi:hypothetical protein
MRNPMEVLSRVSLATSGRRAGWETAGAGPVKCRDSLWGLSGSRIRPDDKGEIRSAGSPSVTLIGFVRNRAPERQSK